MELGNTNESSEKWTTPSGFGKGVNDYFNHYITVADAKAGALLAANFVILGGLISLDICFYLLILYLLTGIFSFISIIYCCIALYPRLPKSSKGIIFWENIKGYSSKDEYLAEISRLDEKTLECEYALQNWCVSVVLSKKNKYVRNTIWTFCIALFFLVITFSTHLVFTL